MKFFLDTANIKEIERIHKLGLVDGVTTNPSIIAKEGGNFKELIKQICGLIDGPVSAEVIGLTVEEMIEEAHELVKWSPNVVVKLPMTESGLEATSRLSKEGIKTNVTLVFTAAQGLLAAKAGATYISPFVGRLDDISSNGLELVKDLKTIMQNYQYPTEIIVASVRSIQHVEQAAVAGADIATIPGSLFPSLWKHPLTDTGIERFLKDWEQASAASK
ncbi:fructose-6-phosphate aldolase [Brevibacillus massiliensis]|jgi:transaldolase|uniref:fructose-6-phosphate aldolase n=1 Tax=Brevibacillus massiliensis TaxID=1118054 RepID=UPI0003094680|nr:fructose-6-phosphate aldolase [Brevibacillus massiliensis]